MFPRNVLRRELHGETYFKRGPRRARLKDIEPVKSKSNEPGISLLQSVTSLQGTFDD